MISLVRRRPRALRALLAHAGGALVVAMLGVACAPHAHAPGGRIGNAPASRVTWILSDTQPGKDVHGDDVELLPIHGGDLVRIEASGPVEVGQRLRAGTGIAEEWTTLTPFDGKITLRASVLASAILARKGTIGRAHIGHGFDPGYDWFQLESDVLQWANGPLPAPFPKVGPAERIDYPALAQVDRLLADAVAHSKDGDDAREAATAVRAVIGLRVLRTLRAPVGFPYFYDRPAKVLGGAAPIEGEAGARAYVADRTTAVEVEIEGPRLLHVFAKARREDADETIDIRVVEGDRERARSSSGVPRAPGRTETAPTPGDWDTVSIRRALVHVPPGTHVYRIVTDGAALVTPMVADPVVHAGDAILGDKDEERLLGVAAHVKDSPPIRALALELLGRDGTHSAEWKEAIAGLAPTDRPVLDALASGAPRDPSISLEIAASHGDVKSLEALAGAGMHAVDDTLRGAWVRGTLRGTRWVVAESHAKTTWTALLFETSEGDTCTKAESAAWAEVGAQESTFATTTWRGMPTLELLARVGCDGKAPIALDVDGESLSPNPSSPLARWHVLVAQKTARARRVDGGEGHLYAVTPEAAGCGAHWGAIGAPLVASTSPSLAYGPDVSAPGIEVWLRDGGKATELTVSGARDAATDVPAARRVRIVITPQPGFAAIDPDGVRWVRAGRVPLPTWASSGAVVSGGADVAVRAIVRAPKLRDDAAPPLEAWDAPDPVSGAPREPEPLDEAKLLAVTRALLAVEGAARGPHHLERATMLAVGGATRAALEDARAAKALGAMAPNGEDPVAYVKSLLRPAPRKARALPAGTRAYGVESDFDPGAPRCSASTSGPRARLAALVDELKTAKAAQTKTFDAKLAIRALEAVGLDPFDPRGASVLQRALAGSRWMTPKTLDGALKVQRPSDAQHDGPLDADGELRARIATGMPFDRGSYATIYEGRPAKAGLTGTDGAKAHVELACAPRSPADALDARCPVLITVGTGAPLHPVVGADGRAKIDLPALPAKGKQAQVTIAIDPSPGRWEAVARIVFDQETPGTTKVEGVGWLLMPPGLERRFLVKGGEQIGANVAQPTLVRIDAIAEPDEHPRVVVVIDGKELALPVDGAPHMFAVEKPGPVLVRAIGGAATVVFAERVAKATLPDPLAGAGEDVEPDVAHSEPADAAEPVAASTRALLDANGAGFRDGSWRDVAAHSPEPLSSFQEHFGTVTTAIRTHYGTLREGVASVAPDGFVEQGVGYRRKIEAIGLWTGFGGEVRERTGHPSYSANALLYEEFSRLRLAAWVQYWHQNIAGEQVHTWKPRGFVEYSVRITPNFFLLPRLGFDGFYSNVSAPPILLTNVDDEVYNDFRFKHPTETFAQLLAWWVPYINNIVYLRSRATFDPVAKALDHAAVRPGVFFAIGNAELGVYGDLAWYRATEGIRAESKVNITGSSYALYNIWINDGSVDVQAGLGGRARTYDYGWEVYALVNVFASFHRGLRDFTSLELNFPEALGGGVAWRGPMAGGGR